MFDNIQRVFIISPMPDNQKANLNRPKKGHQAELQFGPLGESVFSVLPIGVVAFGHDLKVIEANPRAAELITLDQTIDKSLAKGTDPEIWQNWTEQLRDCLSKSKIATFESVSYKSSADDKQKQLRITCTPLDSTNSSAPIGGIVTIEDITDVINVQRQLVNAEKLAAVGKLASKVAHELNNPMDGILRYINLTLRIIEQEKLDKPKEYLGQCKRGLMRMVQIVSDLLEFSRSTYISFEYVKIEELIEDAIKTMDTKVHASNVKISRNYTAAIPKVRTGNLFQVFCNLIKNALEAMGESGALTISTHMTADGTIVVKLQDTGPGFAPENEQLLFEPFFTTKDKDKGTGLGLAICKDIIDRYNGRITAENAPAGGSIFTVYLPIENQINESRQ